MEKLDDHYAKLLGLEEPWRITGVDLRLEESKVEIALEHSVGQQVKCPECGGKCAIADHAPVRRWRHLDTMQFTTELVARIPRADCPGCGVKTIAVPWADKSSRFTLMFEAFAIKVIDACGTVSKAAGLLGLDWDAVQRIMARGVERGLERRALEDVEYVGMDEKSFRRGHRYITLLNDIGKGRVLEVVEGRKETSADALWDGLGEDVRGGIKAVAIDMWEAFINSAKKNVPGADVVHDRYHVSAHLGKALNSIRSKEHRELTAQGDDSLKGSKFLWLFNVDNLTEEKWRRFEPLLELDLRSAEAWALKENMRWFWGYKHAGNAKKFFDKWYGEVVAFGEAAMVKVANMLKSHLPDVLNYFRHRITNAVSEGLNSKIQSIKSAARGFRGFANYRTRILFFCGKLDMRLSSATH
jgi:transposase